MALQVIREDVLTQIEKSVAEFVKQTNVKCALVADKSGQLISQVGFTSSLDLRSLAALVSGIFVSGEELARLLGEAHFLVLYHEGRNMSIFFSLVASDYIFVTIFDDRTNMGIVQLYSNEVKESLAPLLSVDTTAPTSVTKEELENFAEETGEKILDDGELEDFFGQGMDDFAELFDVEDETPDEKGDAESVKGVSDRDDELLLELGDMVAGEEDDGGDLEQAEEQDEEADDGVPLGDSLDDLFSFDEEEEQEDADGDELSRLFDDITTEEDEDQDQGSDLKSLREGLDDLFDL